MIAAADLDRFVRHSDELGGPETPACRAYWEGFAYRPAAAVDQALDPFSEAYVAQQLALHREIAGRLYRAAEDEQLRFALDRHAAAPNPYDHPSPAGLALHLERLARALRQAAVPRGGRLLDMGCGWGLSSELAAYAGARVTAIDINPDFAALVNARAARSGLPIRARQAAFEEVGGDAGEGAGGVGDGRFDAVLFYECLHHAVRPWAVIARVRRLLAPGGRLVLAGEPINAVWWTHWGLRLDAISIYSMRKHGWFESGWSLDFLQAMLAREELGSRVVGHPEAEVGVVVVAANPPGWHLSAEAIARAWRPEGWSLDGSHLASLGAGTLVAPFPRAASGVRLVLRSFRNRAIAVEVRAGTTVHREAVGAAGAVLDLPRQGDVLAIACESELWCPDAELGNGDRRRIGCHLESASFF